AHVFISSELGADKPDPEIFRRALKGMNLSADEVVHVGDDPERDWKAATAAGSRVFLLDRSRNSLCDLLDWVGRDSNPEPTPNQRLKRALLYRLSYRPAQFQFPVAKELFNPEPTPKAFGAALPIELPTRAVSVSSS